MDKQVNAVSMTCLGWTNGQLDSQQRDQISLCHRLQAGLEPT